MIWFVNAEYKSGLSYTRRAFSGGSYEDCDKFLHRLDKNRFKNEILCSDILLFEECRSKTIF
jgi:hypothetical protein